MDVSDSSEDVDLVLRHVSRQFPEELARALLPPGTPVTAVAWQETQVTGRQRRLDRTLDITAGGKRRREHVEWQMVMAEEMPYRIFEYHSLLAMATAGKKPSSAADPPIQSTVVVLSGPERPWPAEGSYRTSPPEASFSGVTFRIDAVYQRTVAELEARGPLWMIFAPLAVDADPESMARVLAKMRAQIAGRELEELAVGLTVMADADPRRRGLRSVIVGLLSEEIVMESWVYKQGEQKGIDRGQAEMLLALLATKFGQLPAEVQERVRKANREETSLWATRLLTAATVDEVLGAPAALAPT